jgi:hypothetical protein
MLFEIENTTASVVVAAPVWPHPIQPYERVVVEIKHEDIKHGTLFWDLLADGVVSARMVVR